jgi:Phosphoinositide phospholipase C, Ca2+-dependent
MTWHGLGGRVDLLAFAVVCCAFGASAVAGDPRLNQIQVIGSHNSYHIAPAPSVLGLIAAGGRRNAEALDYTHRPLAEQFSQLGIRQIELDVFADPKGGLYAAPTARKILSDIGNEPGPDPNAGGQLASPGLKVLHVQDIDFRTTAPTFVDALKQIRAWSQANRQHVPILILVELKDQAIRVLSTRPVPFDREMIEKVDAEILSVFKRTEILTPDTVRGRFATLPEAIRAQGWPALDAVRGQVMFALDNEDSKRDLYLDGHPALRDRLMFVTVEPTHAAAAWFKINDPIKDFDRIQRLVREGFLVRTRADADTVQARAGDVTQRDKALASGAQFVSTDYREPDARFSKYQVQFPGGVVARTNPVSGDPLWDQIDLESKKPGSGSGTK